MPKNTPPPTCPKCSKPMRFLLKKTGGRKFQCIGCDGDDPLRSPEVSKLLTGELRPLDDQWRVGPAGLVSTGISSIRGAPKLSCGKK
jgi:hypothetical protein